MADEYVNIKSDPVYAIPDKERLLLQADCPQPSEMIGSLQMSMEPMCNIDIYSGEDYLETIVNVDYTTVGGSWYENNANMENGFRINVPAILQQNGYTEGYFKVKVHFVINIIGSPFDNQLFVKSISQDRTELELAAVDPEATSITDGESQNSAFNTFVSYGGPTAIGNKLLFNLKTPNGKSLLITNQYYFDTSGLVRMTATGPVQSPSTIYSVAVKLFEGAPKDLEKLQACWIDIDVIPPRELFINLKQRYVDSEPYTELAEPNFHSEYMGMFREGDTTNTRSFEDITSRNIDVKDKIVTEVLSGSLGGVSVNVDHRDFGQFIHFSSAEERIRNFHYKIKQLETYNSRIQALSSDYANTGAYTGQSAVTQSSPFIVNRKRWEKKRQALLGSFDHFEKWMYYESSSYESSSYGLFPSMAWPKKTTSPPYELYSYTSSQVDTWYGKVDERKGVLYSASLFDNMNPHNLRKLIPNHITADTLNDHYQKYIDMMGQHFDIVYNLTKEIGNVNDRQEGLNKGLSKDLVYDVLKSYGWNPVNGYH